MQQGESISSVAAVVTGFRRHSMLKRLVQALRRGRTDRPPFWFMRQAGRYLPEYQRLRREQPDFLRFCYTPELALEATLQPLRRFRPDAAILFSDILVVADALGRDVRFVEGQGPVLKPLTGADEIRNLSTASVEEHLAPVYDAVRRIAAELTPEVALIGFAGAPWTMALYMIEGRGGTEGTRARTWAYSDPDGFAALIAVLVSATTEHLGAQINAGAEAVQLFDSWSGLLAAEEFRRWVIAPTAEIVRRLRSRHPTVPIIGFPRGAGLGYQEYAQATKVDAVGLDPAVPIEWAAAVLKKDCAVQGNLDNQLLKVGGAALDRATDRLIEVLGGEAYVFNLGHGVLPETPPENVARVAERLHAATMQGTA
jgi:uroporphyrinogen decarboxylase